MKITRCDIHPDRKAVATFRIIKYTTVGVRPLLYLGADGYIVDLCEECATKIPKKEHNGSPSG